MEPKTIITALCITLFIASIVIIAQIIWSNKEIGFLRNVIYKLNEENSRLNVELDITAEQRDDNRTTINKLNTTADDYSKLYLEYRLKCKQQSKRIAELIELCDKLQPDLVGKQEIKVDEEACKAMPGLNSTRSDQLICSAIDDQIKNLMLRNIAYNASKLDVDINEEFYNSQKQK